jgi:hypothetical protein
MTTNKAGLGTISDLKKDIIANAVATGNSFAFRDLFSCLGEFSDTSDSGDDVAVPPEVSDRLDYLLPGEEASESPELKSAREFVGRHEPAQDSIPAAILEETGGRAVRLGKFTYAEDAYRQLGIKKEIVALYAQAGEQFMRDGEAKKAAMSFFIAASIKEPRGPQFQQTGPQLHERCLIEPAKCVTALPTEQIIDAGIHLLLSDESLAGKLISSAGPEQKAEALAILATCNDTELSGFIENLRGVVSEFSGIDSDKPADYAFIGPALLGRETATKDAWQYMRELCFEHPLAALCLCTKPVHDTPILVPVIRDGKPLIDHLLPPGFSKA